MAAASKLVQLILHIETFQPIIMETKGLADDLTPVSKFAHPLPAYSREVEEDKD